MKRFGVIGRRETVPITLGERTGHLKASGCRSPRYSSSYNRMKKTVLVLAGLSLFTASCHHQSKPAESPAAYESRVRPTLKREADREGFILTEKGELFKQEQHDWQYHRLGGSGALLPAVITFAILRRTAYRFSGRQALRSIRARSTK